MPSVLLAAVAMLIFGASLSPEVPLIVVGSTAAALLMRRAQLNVLSMVMFLGGIAAIGTIFGNPFVTAFKILEFAAMGLAPKVILLPAFVALGAGFRGGPIFPATFIGVAGAAIAPFAIIGAVSGFVEKDAVDRLKSRRSSTRHSGVNQPIS